MDKEIIVFSHNDYEIEEENHNYALKKKISLKQIIIYNNLSHLLDKTWGIYEENGISFIGYIEENDFIPIYYELRKETQ